MSIPGKINTTKNKGKERENSYQKLKRFPMERHTNTPKLI